MNLLLDFDGVITDETEHAAIHRSALIDELTRITGLKKETVERDFVSAEETARRNPLKYGFFVNGLRVTFPEDYFMLNNAAVWIMSSRNTSYADAIARDYKMDAGLFSIAVFDRATKNAKPSFRKNAADVLRELLKNKKITTTIVSNSSTDKINRMLQEIKVDVPVVGAAQKFDVDKSFNKIDEFLFVGRSRIELRRMAYYELLQKFGESIVVGDVFSNDLALPLYTRQKIVLLLNPYTPKWSKLYCKRHGSVIRDFGELPALVEKLAH